MDEEFLNKFNRMAEDIAATRRISTDTKADMETLKIEVIKLQSAMGESKEKIEEIEVRQYKTENRIADFEQYSRKLNVIINGISSSQEENLTEIVFSLANKLEVPLKEYHICALHRLPGKKKPFPITLKLNNLEIKQMMVKNSKIKKLSERDFGGEDREIFIDEHLTRETMELLRGAKELREKEKIKFVRCKDGKVMVRESESKKEGPITTVIQVYAPTNVATEQKIIEFYQNLEETIENINKDLLIVMENWNAKVDRDTPPPN